MPDVFSQAKRSAVMSRIRGTGNKDTELRFIALMRAAGIRGWRRNAILRFEVEGGKLKSIASGTRASSAPVRTSVDQRRLACPSETARRRARSTGSWQATALHLRIKPDFVFTRMVRRNVAGDFAILLRALRFLCGSTAGSG